MEVEMSIGEPAWQLPLQGNNPTISLANQKVLDYVESTFTKVIQEIQVRPCGKPTIALSRITAIRPYYDEDDHMRLKWHVEDREVIYSFPGKNKDDAWRFACLGRILGEIYTAIKQGVVVTKRDIFYRDPGLFKQQATVDRYVDDIAHTCGVTRRDLNIVASPKGLVAGLGRGDVAIIQDNSEATTLDQLEDVNWILVVEKEAIFNTLVETKFHHHPIIGRGVLLTARGYPDLATRRFLRALLDLRQSVTVFGLFDNDPDGIRILKCYLYGSKSLAQEHACNLPEMEWIGLKSEDLVFTAEQSSLPLQLSSRDRVTAMSMLNSDEWRDGSGRLLPGLVACYAELQRMLWLNQKAEIQILDSVTGGVYDWLTRRLQVALDHV